jgi:hypothetical protein
MVDREIFSRRLEALHGYLDKLRAFRDVDEAEFVREPALHHLPSPFAPSATNWKTSPRSPPGLRARSRPLIPAEASRGPAGRRP